MHGCLTKEETERGKRGHWAAILGSNIHSKGLGISSRQGVAMRAEKGHWAPARYKWRGWRDNYRGMNGYRSSTRLYAEAQEEGPHAAPCESLKETLYKQTA